MTNSLGDCQYRHDWIDGKCNTCGAVDSMKRIAALEAQLHRERDEFKNFHQHLCNRFGYFHDDIDWKRDQVSLIEHIAGQLDALTAAISQLREEVRMANACVVQACTTSEPTVFNQPQPRGDIREALSGSHVLAQIPKEKIEP